MPKVIIYFIIFQFNAPQQRKGEVMKQSRENDNQRTDSFGFFFLALFAKLRLIENKSEVICASCSECHRTCSKASFLQSFYWYKVYSFDPAPFFQFPGHPVQSTMYVPVYLTTVFGNPVSVFNTVILLPACMRYEI